MKATDLLDSAGTTAAVAFEPAAVVLEDAAGLEAGAAPLRLVSRAFEEPLAMKMEQAMQLRQLAIEARGGEYAATIGLRAGAAARAMYRQQPAAAMGGDVNSGKAALYQQVGSVAVINITGVLDKTEADVTDSFGQKFGTSYQGLMAAVDSALNASAVKGIVLNVDSPGGAAMSVEPAALAIRAAKAQKPVWAYSNDLNASAALYLSSQASKLFVSPGSWTGSIGVIQLVADYSGQMAQRGIKITAIKSTPHKDTGSPYRAMNETDAQILQAEVDKYDAMFIDAVAAGRGVDAAAVRKWQAAHGFIGSDAVDAGLAAGVRATLMDVIDEMNRSFSAGVAGTGRSAAVAAGNTGEVQPARMVAAVAAAVVADRSGTMADETKTGGGGGGTVADAVTAERAGAAASQARVNAIMDRARPFGGNAKISALRDTALADPAYSAEKFSAEALKVLADEQKPTAHVPGGGDCDVAVGREATDANREVMTAAILARIDGEGVRAVREGGEAGKRAERVYGFEAAGGTGKVFAEAQRRHGGMRLEMLARVCIAKAMGMSLEQTMVRLPISEAKKFMAAAFHTASDFPLILEAAANKSMLRKFNEASLVWRNICAVAPATDFKTIKVYALSSGGDLELVPEGGRPSEMTFGERRETAAVDPYGRQFSFTYQMMRNDDLAAFAQWQSNFGASSARLPETLLMNALKLNSGLGPTMSDGATLIHSTHSNVGAGAALSYASAQADVILMTKQVDFKNSNVYLDIRPASLLVPIALKFTAENLAKQQYVPGNGIGATNELNVLNGAFKPLATTRLTGTRRYWFTDPADVPAATMYFLDGQEAPVITQDPTGDPLSQKFQGTLLGCGIGFNQWECVLSDAGA